ncbi:MAG: CorA family divalent cation transporter [Emergencia sp.]
MITILEADRIEQLTSRISSSVVRRLDEQRNFFMLLGEKQYFLAFHWLDGRKVTIYADTADLVIVTDSEAVTEYAGNIDIEDSGIHQLYEFFLELTASDVYKLESLENLIISLEDSLLMDSRPGKDGIRDIIKVRKDLLKVKRYYEQMEFLTDEIAAVDPTFSFIDRKFDRLLEFVLHLQEYIETVREAYQSQIDIEQNNIMKVFTVVTSIFLPLTLITGWYGMNLQMPEFRWSLGYPFVICVSLLVVGLLIVIFKKKKWF